MSGVGVVTVLSAGSLVAIGVLMGVSILADVLFSSGGGMAEACMPSFFISGFGFLFFGWPAAYRVGGMFCMFMAVVFAVVANIMLALRLVFDIIDAFSAPKSGAASIAAAYVQVVSRGNASVCTASGSSLDHAPVPPTVSTAGGQRSPGWECDGIRAYPTESAGVSKA